MASPKLNLAKIILAATTLVAAGCTSNSPTVDTADATERMEYLLGVADPATAKEISFDLVRRSQESIQSCMRGEGFEYVPQSPQSLFIPGPQLELSREDFAQNYGLGYISLSGPNVALPTMQLIDPNVENLNAMTDAEQEAWSRQIDECELSADSTIGVVRDRAAVQTAIAALKTQIDQDRRVVEATGAWSTCMRKAGFSYAHPEAMHTDAQQAAANLVEAGAWEEGAARHDEFHAQLDREVEIGLANLLCGEGLLEAERDALGELQDDFLNQYGDELVV